MRIVLAILAVSVVVYVVVRLLQRRGAREVTPPAAPREPGSLRAAADFQRQVRERAEQQRRGITPTPPPEPEIVIDPDVFTYDESLDHSHETFVVITDAEQGSVHAALTRAAARFMRVDETGREHPDWEAAEAAMMQDLYTPNYVSDPEPTDAGLRVYVDCKGVVPDGMATTFHRILREELGTLRTPVRVSVFYSDE